MAKTITLTQTASPNTAITINAPAYPEMRGESYPMIYGRTMGGGIKWPTLAPARPPYTAIRALPLIG